VLPPRKERPADQDRTQSQPRWSQGRTDARPVQNPRLTISPRDPAGGLPTGRRTHAEAPGGSSERRFEKPFRPAKPARPRPDFSRPSPPEDDDYVPNKKTPGFRIEPVIERPREEKPRGGGFSRPAPGGKPFRSVSGRPAGGERPFRPKTDRPDRPFSSDKPFRPRTDRPAEGRGPAPSGDRPFRPRGEFRSGGAPRPVSGDRPARFSPRQDGPPSRRPKSFGAGTENREDRPREFRPRTGGAPPKKFTGARPGGPERTGPDGEPRKKERWRNSFTGKNKGRPKPKPKKDQ